MENVECQLTPSLGSHKFLLLPKRTRSYCREDSHRQRRTMTTTFWQSLYQAFMRGRFNDNNHNNQDVRADALIKWVYKLPKIPVLTDQVKNKDNISKTLLVVQELRIHFAMQGMWVQFLFREWRSHMPQQLTEPAATPETATAAEPTGPMGRNYWSPYATTRGSVPIMKDLHDIAKIPCATTKTQGSQISK